MREQKLDIYGLGRRRASALNCYVVLLRLDHQVELECIGGPPASGPPSCVFAPAWSAGNRKTEHIGVVARLQCEI